MNFIVSPALILCLVLMTLIPRWALNLFSPLVNLVPGCVGETPYYCDPIFCTVRYLPGGTDENQENPACWHSWSFSIDMNPQSPKYKAGTLPLNCEIWQQDVFLLDLLNVMALVGLDTKLRDFHRILTAGINKYTCSVNFGLKWQTLILMRQIHMKCFT